MKIIKTQQDIDVLRCAVVLPAMMIEHVARYFRQLEVALQDDEQYVFDRLAEVVQKPKIVEDVVRKLNKDRTVNVIPLQKEREAIDRELASVDGQRKKYFILYERDGVNEELLIERLNEFKEQQERSWSEKLTWSSGSWNAPPTRFR